MAWLGARALAVALIAGAAATAPAAVAHRGSHDQPVAILMYHVISTAPAGAPYPELYVPASEFERQVTWLVNHDYNPVTLQSVYDEWTKGTALPSRPVVLTFDDGYLSQYTHAFRDLQVYGWPGVINLEVRHLQPRSGLRPWRIRKLIAAGWEIDAHTITHPDLTTVDDARLRHEVAGSRALIRSEFHVPVDFFCYPSGRYDEHVVAEVRAAGYLGATTERYGLAEPPSYFTLARIRINGSDGVAGFAAKLENARPAP
jgi:peptidoglycan/xylan/chitin deacetylase (PgdA/CDA1 family)